MNTTNTTTELLSFQHTLQRIAEALERLSPPPPTLSSLSEALTLADALVWHPRQKRLDPVPHVAHISIDLLCGITHQQHMLLNNTRHFARGLPANNAMLWGARGMGKSSLVKAVHAHINKEERERCSEYSSIVLVEIQRDDLSTLPNLLALLRPCPRRFILFCDDLSFEKDDYDYKALKSVLDGGITGRPDNVIFYATSNRRHLISREMIENEQTTAINPSEVTEEKVSLSDRFGLWLGFHPCEYEVFLQIVKNYARDRNLPISDSDLITRAHEWAVSRGSRSGRVAFQFIEDLQAQLTKA